MNTIDWPLLKGEAIGTNTPEESAEVKVWLSASADNRAYYARMERFLAQETKTGIDTNRSFREFMRRANASPRRAVRRIVSTVAAACLIATGVFIYKPQHKSDEEIVAGSHKAVLHTGDGKIVILADDTAAELLLSENLTVTRDHNGVSYRTSEAGKDAGVMHVLETPHGSEYRLQLSDGTSIHLNAESRVSFPTVFSGGERRISMSGEAYFEVAHSDKPFIVETEGMEIRVLGTEFNVRAYGSEQVAHTTLVGGSVEIVANDRTLRLAPGEQALLERGRAITMRVVDTGKYAAWKEGHVAFEDERLEDIIVDLSRWYNFDVKFDDLSLREIRFTGSIDRYDDIRILLEKIEKLNVVRFRIDGTHITVQKQ